MRPPLTRLCSRLLQMLPPSADPKQQPTPPPSRAGKQASDGPTPRTPSASGSSSDAAKRSLYDDWLASRAVPAAPARGADPLLLTPGAQRPLTRENALLALAIARRACPGVLALLWELYPWRMLAMLAMDLCRGVFPAFRGYSQALIINEFQAVISSGDFNLCGRLFRLIATELLRVALESGFDSFATANEEVIQSSARFVMEYRQMEQRVRMDLPTLADPHIRDLFHESDLFVRSFNGTANFGLFSPLDLLRILTLLSETLSHALVLWTLTANRTHLALLAFSVASYLLPLLLAWWHRAAGAYADDAQDVPTARATAKQNKMRAMAQSDAHRAEVVLFGLGPWILEYWAKARRTTLGLDRPRRLADDYPLGALLSNINTTGLVLALQNIPVVLALQASSTTLGSFTLYRGAVEAIVLSVRQLVQLARMAFQGVFLMGAFAAAMEVQPRLQPPKEDRVPYPASPKGMAIELRNVSYTYPGSREPALRNVSLSLGAGETLAIVGLNGSGKSTLASILLRLLDYSSGSLHINGTDARRLAPDELHARCTAVLQGFARFDGASVRENVGVGFVPDMRAAPAVAAALALAGADRLVAGLPQGVKTRLDAAGAQGQYKGESACPRGPPHGLSGGEWQRIAVSRAFMRARRPEVELILLDEPTAALDAHAQNRVFETVDAVSRVGGARVKTVVFVTHRLATARRADKIAMMHNGTIVEFGTHEQLLARGGSYASLYQASI